MPYVTVTGYRGRDWNYGFQRVFGPFATGEEALEFGRRSGLPFVSLKVTKPSEPEPERDMPLPSRRPREGCTCADCTRELTRLQGEGLPTLGRTTSAWGTVNDGPPEPMPLVVEFTPSNTEGEGGEDP